MVENVDFVAYVQIWVFAGFFIPLSSPPPPPTGIDLRVVTLIDKAETFVCKMAWLLM